jgi:integrase
MKAPLTARQVAALKKPGRYAVGDGGYLQVTGENGRSWVFRYQRNGRGHWLGLGPASLVTLAEARERARQTRRLLHDGIDPLEARAAKRAQVRLAAAKATTFREAAERYIATHEAGWRSDVHRLQWTASLATHAFPVIGELPVADIDTPLVLKVLEPIWSTTTETASRLRGRIESVLDWARVRGMRDGENPARWRGHLDHLLPPPRKVSRVEHHAALPYADLPTFMADLRQHKDIAAIALEFVILNAARSGEVLGARWSEIDGDVWTVPAKRIKAGIEHRVPLSPRALEILGKLPRDGALVFPGRDVGKPVSRVALLRLLHRMGRVNITVHGFRACFRTWGAEQTNYPHEICEAALAHAVPNAVVRAYKRTDLFERRRRLMNDWASYCESPVVERGAVVPLRSV